MMNMGNYKERLVANAKLAEQKALDKIEGDAKRQAQAEKKAERTFDIKGQPINQ